MSMNPRQIARTATRAVPWLVFEVNLYCRDPVALGPYQPRFISAAMCQKPMQPSTDPTLHQPPMVTDWTASASTWTSTRSTTRLDFRILSTATIS